MSPWSFASPRGLMKSIVSNAQSEAEQELLANAVQDVKNHKDYTIANPPPCDLPPYDDSSKNHDFTFSNPLFDIDEDFTLSDESFSEEDIPKENFIIFSNPLFDLDEEIASTKSLSTIIFSLEASVCPLQANSDDIESLPPSTIPVADNVSLWRRLTCVLLMTDQYTRKLTIDVVEDFPVRCALMFSPTLPILEQGFHTIDCPDCEDSQFCHSSRVSHPQLQLGIRYPNLID
ncbi:hypothetical protein Tco_0185276 [Tanacetum coccineum]